MLYFSEMRDKMRKWREENSRNSEQIMEVGEELINDYASKLGDDSKCSFIMCRPSMSYDSSYLMCFYSILRIRYITPFLKKCSEWCCSLRSVYSCWQ